MFVLFLYCLMSFSFWILLISCLLICVVHIICLQMSLVENQMFELDLICCIIHNVLSQLLCVVMVLCTVCIHIGGGTFFIPIWDFWGQVGRLHKKKEIGNGRLVFNFQHVHLKWSLIVMVEELLLFWLYFWLPNLIFVGCICRTNIYNHVVLHLFIVIVT